MHQAKIEFTEAVVLIVVFLSMILRFFLKRETQKNVNNQ